MSNRNRPRWKKSKRDFSRYFFSQKQMREYRRLEDLMHARAKREGRKVKSTHGVACGCGCGPFPIERDWD